MAKSLSQIKGDKMEKEHEAYEEMKTGLRQDAFKDKEFQIERHVNPEHYKQQCSLECIDTMIMVFGANIRQNIV